MAGILCCKRPHFYNLWAHRKILDGVMDPTITNTHAALSPEDRFKAGISENLVRLSVGIEPVETLMDDLESKLFQQDIFINMHHKSKV